MYGVNAEIVACLIANVNFNVSLYAFFNPNSQFLNLTSTYFSMTVAAPPMVLSDDQPEDPSSSIVECVPVSPMQQDNKKPILPPGVASGKELIM